MDEAEEYEKKKSKKFEWKGRTIFRYFLFFWLPTRNSIQRENTKRKHMLFSIVLSRSIFSDLCKRHYIQCCRCMYVFVCLIKGDGELN